MSRLSMNEMTTFRWSFEEDVARYAAAGIPAIGVWRQKLSDYGEDKGIELLAEHGLAVSNLLWAGGFTGSDGRSHRDAVADGREAIRLAAAMRAGCLVIYSGGRSGHTQTHARRLFLDALHLLAPLAEELDVPLAVEPMHPGCAGDWTFLTNLEETLGLIREIESTHVRLAFDTYHLGFDAALLESIPQIAPSIGIVHLADGRHAPNGEQNRCRLGEGSLPLAAILQALERAGYTGDYDVELLGEDMEAADYGELLTHVRQAFAQLAPA